MLASGPSAVAAAPARSQYRPQVATSKRSARSPGRNPAGAAPSDSFASELAVAGDRHALVARIDRLGSVLEAHGLSDDDWQLIELGRAAKKNFAQKFSNAIAQKTANALRPKFKGILPDENGKGQESKAAGSAGLKKLDVNYSNTAIGLGLAVSIKTTNFKDEATHRYTKNVKRVDGELRAEAQDCHERQPFSVLVALWFFPADAATDGRTEEGGSSLVHAATTLARRCGRVDDTEDASKFELGFIGVYTDAGHVDFYPADASFPASGLPPEPLTFSAILKIIEATFDRRNRLNSR